MGDIAVDIFLETLKQLITNSKIRSIIGEKHQLQSLEIEIKYLREFLKVTEKKRNENVEVMNMVRQIRDVVFESENTVELFVSRAYKQERYKQYDLLLDLESVKKEIKTLTAKVKQMYDENMYDETLTANMYDETLTDENMYDETDEILTANMYDETLTAKGKLMSDENIYDEHTAFFKPMHDENMCDETLTANMYDETLTAKGKQMYDENMYDETRTALLKRMHEFPIDPKKKKKRMHDHYETLTAKVKQMGYVPMHTRGSVGSSLRRIRRKNTSKVVEEKTMVGFEDEVETLMGKLHDSGEGGRLEIISIIGVGGGGKTTLAREVFNRPLTSQKFEIRAWASVSQDYHKTMKRDLLISILESASREKYEDYGESSEDKLGEMVHKCLKGRKYLIVMDDIWNIEAWNDIQRSFPKECKGSKVMLTSRLRVQPASIPCVPHYLKPLSESCSWELLQKKVFGKKQCPPRLVDIGKQIAEKCKGLPLAVIAIAGILAIEDKTLNVWEKTAKHLSSIIAKNQEGCMEILELSYNHLPLHLQACFLYIGGHPEDSEIPVRELIWLWIAEGFIQQSDGGKSLEAIAQDYLIDLIDRNLVMVARKSKSHGGIKACHIHDILRELCLKKAEEDNFLVRYLVAPSATNKHRRLFIGRHVFREFPPMSRAQNLRSFLDLSLSNPLLSLHEHNLSLFVENFELLRVLYLSSATSRGEIRIGDLVHLRYLAPTLPYEELRRALNSFDCLSNLETFNLKFAYGWERNISLPRDIVKMVKLRHLYTKRGIFEYHHVSNYDEKEGNMLDSLQTLHRICACEHCLRLLERTPNLRKLGLCGDRGHILVDLEFLKCLEILYFASTTIRLKLPPTLTQLTLEYTYLKWEELSIILQTLPRLEVLKLLTYACEGPVWNTSELEEGFDQLKYLMLERLVIKEWNVSEDQFRSLEVLVIKECIFLKQIPIDFANLYELREITIGHCLPSAVKSAREIQEEQRKTRGDDHCLNITFLGDS